MPTITEHSATISLTPPKKDVTAKMPTFYNPVMVSNRNISITLLNALNKTNLKIALPLAASGIRAIRFLSELNSSKVKHLHCNDIKQTFIKEMNKTLKKNKLASKKISLHSQDANLFLLQGQGFDYIDIDPFGTPNPFLASSIAAISREGILAVTATDTAALTGTYPKVTRRKYYARNLRTPWMHEMGLRILIRKVQLQGIQFDKALTPILSYHKDHYFRIYFECQKGKTKCDNLLDKHQYFLYNPQTLQFKTSPYNKLKDHEYLGPLWTGSLFHKPLLSKMQKHNTFAEDQKFLGLLNEESKNDVTGFHDIHALAKKYKHEPPKFEPLLKKYNGTRTHLSPYGIKTKKKLNRASICP